MIEIAHILTWEARTQVDIRGKGHQAAHSGFEPLLHLVCTLIKFKKRKKDVKKPEKIQ